jgi:DNA-binding transcriptional LysR family regulator
VQGDDRWSLVSPAGEKPSVPVKGPLRSNNLSAVQTAARAGMGLVVLPWLSPGTFALTGTQVWRFTFQS